MVTFCLFQDGPDDLPLLKVIEGGSEKEMGGSPAKDKTQRCESKILQDLSRSVFLEFR